MTDRQKASELFQKMLLLFPGVTFSEESEDYLYPCLMAEFFVSDYRLRQKVQISEPFQSGICYVEFFWQPTNTWLPLNRMNGTGIEISHYHSGFEDFEMTVRNVLEQALSQGIDFIDQRYQTQIKWDNGRAERLRKIEQVKSFCSHVHQYESDVAYLRVPIHELTPEQIELLEQCFSVKK